MCRLQVFDHPSVTAIASYISSLPGSAAAAAAASEDFEEEEEPDVVTAADLPLARPLPAGMAVQSAASQQLIGITSLACKTAASNAVIRLPGVDASRRVPFDRWDLSSQEQVGRARACGKHVQRADCRRLHCRDRSGAEESTFSSFHDLFDTHEARPGRKLAARPQQLTHPVHVFLCSWWAACQCSLVSSWTPWTCLMLLPLASVPQRRP